MIQNARKQVEYAFGRLNVLLRKKADLKLQLVSIIIYYCFDLHNFCEQNTTCHDEEESNAQIQAIKRNKKVFKNKLDTIYSS